MIAKKNGESCCENAEVVEQDKERRNFKPQEALAMMIQTKRDTGQSGFFVSEGDVYIKVDHLKPRSRGKHKEEIGPEIDDFQIVRPMQFFLLDVAGEWNFSNERHEVFAVNNVTKNAFQQYNFLSSIHFSCLSGLFPTWLFKPFKCYELLYDNFNVFEVVYYVTKL